MSGVPVLCDWCTDAGPFPAQHENCYGTVWLFDGVSPPREVPCECGCRAQEGLW